MSVRAACNCTLRAACNAVSYAQRTMQEMHNALPTCSHWVYHSCTSNRLAKNAHSLRPALPAVTVFDTAATATAYLLRKFPLSQGFPCVNPVYAVVQH